MLGALLVCAALAVGLVGCGISIGAGEEETEIFKGLTIEGREGGFVTGAPITITLEWEQPYPRLAKVDFHINVDCDLLAGSSTTRVLATPTPADRQPSPTTRKDKVRDLLVETLPENPPENVPEEVEDSLADEATPLSGTMEKTFFAPDLPGEYIVECFTLEDDNNTIERRFSIAPAPESTATPEPTAAR